MAAGGFGSEKHLPLLLGRYEVGRLLGQGNFAKVYFAKNVFTREEVAIKVMDKEKIFKSGLVAHIKREISILRRVRHPNIVRLHEVMATKSKIYFVMEYVSGGELFKRVAKGRLPEDVVRKYFQQLISAVAFCHAHGVYHRDIKPENLLLDDRGDLKVCDFGLSALVEEVRHDGLFHTFCGTPAYVAPEVLTQKGYDGAKADIWSCGVVLFALMAGYPPFHDQNVNGLYHKIYHAQYRCPKWFKPELIRLLRRILDTNVETRITVEQIMEDKWFKEGFRPVMFYVNSENRISTMDDDGDDFPETPTSTVGTDTPRSQFSDSEFNSSPIAPFPPSRSQSSFFGMHGSASAPALMEMETSKMALAQVSAIPRQSSLNAFDIISSNFDLSGMFGDKEEETQLSSSASPERIKGMIADMADRLGFVVRVADGMVSLRAKKNGLQGMLAITAEIDELAPRHVLVRVRKTAGDKAEYDAFCNNELEPALRALTYEHDHAPAAKYTAVDWE